jgi:hypothetical protein
MDYYLACTRTEAQWAWIDVHPLALPDDAAAPLAELTSRDAIASAVDANSLISRIVDTIINIKPNIYDQLVVISPILLFIRLLDDQMI